MCLHLRNEMDVQPCVDLGNNRSSSETEAKKLRKLRGCYRKCCRCVTNYNICYGCVKKKKKCCYRYVSIYGNTERCVAIFRYCQGCLAIHRNHCRCVAIYRCVLEVVVTAVLLLIENVTDVLPFLKIVVEGERTKSIGNQHF